MRGLAIKGLSNRAGARVVSVALNCIEGNVGGSSASDKGSAADSNKIITSPALNGA